MIFFYFKMHCEISICLMTSRRHWIRSFIASNSIFSYKNSKIIVCSSLRRAWRKKWRATVRVIIVLIPRRRWIRWISLCLSIHWRYHEYAIRWKTFLGRRFWFSRGWRIDWYLYSKIWLLSVFKLCFASVWAALSNANDLDEMCLQAN